VAQRRLAALFQSGRVKRNTQVAPYIYYVEKQTDTLRRIAVNWARLWLAKRCKSWERITFDYDTCTCTVVNTATGSSKQYLITDKAFRLPRDNMIILTDESIDRMREELLWG
jgi:hypothetical protein